MLYEVITYKTVNGITEDFPYELNDVIEPVYEELPAWNDDLTTARSLADLPQTMKDYVRYLEHKLEVPISIISVGPNREQTIEV